MKAQTAIADSLQGTPYPLCKIDTLNCTKWPFFVHDQAIIHHEKTELAYQACFQMYR